MKAAKLTLPYTLVSQAAADLLLGSSYPGSTYFDEDTLRRVESTLKRTLYAVFGEQVDIEFSKQ